MPTNPYKPRLNFLKDFMRLANKSYRQIAELTKGGGPQIPFFLQNDNMRISDVYRIVEALGYEVSFSLTDESGQMPVREIESKTGRRLDFLTNALKRYRITKRNVSEALGLHYATVIHMFQVDDTSIQHLWEIADKFNLALHIDIYPADNFFASEETLPGSRVVSTINWINVQYTSEAHP